MNRRFKRPLAVGDVTCSFPIFIMRMAETSAVNRGA
jgi:hypothetical protein